MLKLSCGLAAAALISTSAFAQCAVPLTPGTLVGTQDDAVENTPVVRPRRFDSAPTRGSRQMGPDPVESAGTDRAHGLQIRPGTWVTVS